MGCSREMVSRLMKDLERGGWIVPLDGGQLRLPRPLPARW
jgi:CRP/FNR family cyclic AMP-dependent transcriptional regulator